MSQMQKKGNEPTYEDYVERYVQLDSGRVIPDSSIGYITQRNTRTTSGNTGEFDLKQNLSAHLRPA